MKRAIVAWFVLWTACGGSEPPTRTSARRVEDSAAAVSALQAAKFEVALREASAVLARDRTSSRAAAVRAIARYQAAGHRFLTDLEKVLEEGDHMKLLDHAAGRAVWSTFVDELEAVDKDLAIVAADPAFSLELCLACWEHDWNRSGEVDERDRLLFQLEVDAEGKDLAASDPRRKPTYRFDVGDAEWARAMISFQRAAIEIILAYDWRELDKLFAGMFGKSNDPVITIRVGNAAGVKQARELVIAGLDHADRCRAAYLAETDDDREWVPNPRQRSYAMPLPVDASLYARWAEITGDIRRMLTSEEGISFREAEGLLEEDEHNLWPDAYLDLGAMLREPKDIVIDLSLLDGKLTAQNVERALRGVLGNGLKARMKPSPIVGRLRQMKAELSRGEDTFERKLRYLLWLN